MYPWAAPEAALPGDTGRGDAAVGAGPSVPGLQVLSLGLTHPTEELGSSCVEEPWFGDVGYTQNQMAR